MTMQNKGGLVAIALAVGLAVGGAGCGEDGQARARETTAPPTTTCADITTTSGDDPVICDDGTRPTVPEPTRWPEELALPEGASIVRAQDTVAQVSISAYVVGDFQTTFDQLKAQYLAAGYTITQEAIDDGDWEFGASGVIDGRSEVNLLSINVNEVKEPSSQGNLNLNYVLNPLSERPGH